MRFTITATVLTAILFVFGREVASTNGQGPDDRLPEPAHRFAKDASLRVTEMEQEWLKLSERLGKSQADFALTDKGKTDSSPRVTAERLLAAAKTLLLDHKRAGEELERFKAALKKAATHHREVAALSKVHAAEARANEVKQDYLELAKLYEAKAQGLAERAKVLATPADLKAKADAIAEGNLFIERFLEALPAGPLGDSDQGLFANRLKKQGERCKALTDDLTRAIEKVLEGSDAPDVRAKMGKSTKLGDSASRPMKAEPPKELKPLLGASWSSPVTVQGVRYLQVIRFDEDGTCAQAIYLDGPRGKGQFVTSGSYTFEVDSATILSFYQAGTLVERGEVTVLSKDQWGYEIIGNAVAPWLSGQRLTFTRDVGSGSN